MIPGAQISVGSTSCIPFVSVWLRFINLHDANSHISPLTPQPVLCSACIGRSIHHVLHARWHQLETRSTPFEKPFAQRIWLLSAGENEQFMSGEERERCQASHFYVVIKAYVGSLFTKWVWEMIGSTEGDKMVVFNWRLSPFSKTGRMKLNYKWVVDVQRVKSFFLRMEGNEFETQPARPCRHTKM